MARFRRRRRFRGSKARFKRRFKGRRKGFGKKLNRYRVSRGGVRL